MAQILIRPVEIAESDRAAAIFRQAMRTVPCFDDTLHTPDEDRWFWRERVFPENRVLGAYADGLLIGQAAVAQGWINQFHVQPDWHGHGIGSQLLEAIQAGAPTLQLWTFQANQGARRFYERHGFLAVELTDGQGNEEKEPDVRYVWTRGTP